MAWQTEMTRILRFMIFDLDKPYKFEDERLQECLVVAAQLTTQELDFSQPFLADLNAFDIIPDPTDRSGVPPTRDDSFINLTCMKAACMVDRGKASDAVSQAVTVRDNSALIDMREVAQGRLAILKSGGWCSAFEEARTQYLLSKSHVAGAAIMTPFRVWAGDGRTVWPNAGYMDFRP